MVFATKFDLEWTLFFLEFYLRNFFRRIKWNFRIIMCVQISCYLEIMKKRHEYLCPSPLKWPSSDSRVTFVRRFCLSAIACRKLWPGGCKLSMPRIPSGWIWPSGWGYLFNCKLPCPILADGLISFETLSVGIDIQAKKHTDSEKHRKESICFKEVVRFFLLCAYIEKDVWKQPII